MRGVAIRCSSSVWSAVPLDDAMDLASGPTFSRRENAVSTKDLDLQLPSSCPVKALLHRLTEILFLTRPSTPMLSP